VTYREQFVTAPDGRTLEVATLGDPGGCTVFFHHGTPGSALLASLFEAAADDAGLFVVTTSRPGYSRSSRREGRDVASVVGDARAVLDALGRDEYVSAGWSGGGPHALACAALDAPRCRAAWSLAGVVPHDAGFDWTEGMGPENLEEFALAREGGPRFEAHVAEIAEAFAEATAGNVVGLFGGLLSDADRAALGPEPSRWLLAESCREAFTHGWYGLHDDDRAFCSAWGFDPADIGVPVEVWYGDQDLMVPPTHGAWLARRVPGAREVHRPGDGHVSLVTGHLGELGASWRRAFA
jgi:pimeloyl-ACP methyl ester carboxylesterase